MPDVYIDGKRLDFNDTESNSTISDLIGELEKSLIGLRRFISEIWVDGIKVDNWKSSQAIHKPIAEYKDLNMITVSVEAIALEGLDLVQEYIKLIKDNIGTCVKNIRLGFGDAENEFTEIFEGMIEVVKTMDALTRGGDKYRMALFKENPSIYYKPLLKHLETIRAAKESGDGVLTADILEYELLPFLNEMEFKIFNKYVA